MTSALERAALQTLLTAWLAGCGTTHVDHDDAPVIDAHRAPPVSEVDLLLLVDDSSSMDVEQALFVRELPTLVRGLVSGDLDGDGTADVEGATSVHVGVVTPDLGAGPIDRVPTCAMGLGDDGVLRTQRRATAPPCVEAVSGVFAFDPSRDDVGVFLESVGCVAEVGTGGCGFEQQLEATLKALTPREARDWTRSGYTPPRFLDARGAIDAEAGQGERSNAGFLRPDSVLAIVILTDEEDCSVSDYGLFSADDPRFDDVPLSLRCIRAIERSSEVVRPISRYVEGFVGLRARPQDLVLAAIIGIPRDAQPAAGQVPDFEAILMHPDMIAYAPMGMGREPSCASLRGAAVAPIRFVQLARELSEAGAGVSLVSVCSESYEASTSSILRLVGARLPAL
jgi:hypothetical protein